MGNNASAAAADATGLTANSRIGTADVQAMWDKYDTNKDGYLENEEAHKFLQDFAQVAGIKMNKKHRDQLIRECQGTRPDANKLCRDHFRALVAKVASESKGMSLTQSMAAVMDADDQKIDQDIAKEAKELLNSSLGSSCDE